MAKWFRQWNLLSRIFLTLILPIATIVPYMQTAWIWLWCRVTQRLTWIQAVWHSENFLTNFEWLWSTLKFVADEIFSRRHVRGRITVKSAMCKQRRRRSEDSWMSLWCLLQSRILIFVLQMSISILGSEVTRSFAIVNDIFRLLTKFAEVYKDPLS